MIARSRLRKGDLGIGLAAPVHRAAGQGLLRDRPEGDGIVLELGRVALGRRVGERLHEHRRLARQREDDRTGVGRLGDLLHELLLEVALRGKRQGDLLQRRLECVQLRVFERALVRGDDDQVDDREHARDDEQERERELAADAARAGSPVAEAVADPAHRQDVLGLARLSLELLAQVTHVDVDRPGSR